MSVVEYARARGVRVIPELDAPAHVGEGWQWAGPNVTLCVNAQPWNHYCVEPPCGQLNPTNDTVYEILGGIYRDMFALFKPDIFHMGGDEVRSSTSGSRHTKFLTLNLRELNKTSHGLNWLTLRNWSRITYSSNILGDTTMCG
jgi:N-acetyl-beta-hexosaminidase